LLSGGYERLQKVLQHFSICLRSSDYYILSVGENVDMKSKAGILVLVIGLTATLLSNAGESTVPSFGGTTSDGTVNVMRARIDRIVAELEKEDFDRSVDQLLMGSDLQFMWPGYISEACGSPHTDLEEMLSSRRAIKILNHIQGLSGHDKALACDALFARAFQVHTNLLSVFLQIEADPKIKSKSSVMSSRLTVLLAMFATADSGDRALLAKQFEQHDRFMDDANRIIAEQPPKAKAHMSAYFPLFFPQQNRSQLNLLQLAADRETNRSLNLFSQVEHELEQAKMDKSEVQIVPWNARTTFFETRWAGAGGNVDTNKQVTIYRFYGGVCESVLEKSAQAAFVKKLRGIVLP
jgi:hypothetical protein